MLYTIDVVQYNCSQIDVI